MVQSHANCSTLAMTPDELYLHDFKLRPQMASVKIVCMEAKNFQLELITDRFPKDRDKIVALYYSDEYFRTICEDYYTCLNFLNKFKKEFSDRKGSVEEYEKIRVDLEQELEERIKGNLKI